MFKLKKRLSTPWPCLLVSICTETMNWHFKLKRNILYVLLTVLLHATTQF